MKKINLSIQKGSRAIRNKAMFIGFFSWQVIACQNADLHLRKCIVPPEKVVKPQYCVLDSMMVKSVGQEDFLNLLKNMVDLSVRYEGSKNLLDVAVDSGDVEKVKAILAFISKKQGRLNRPYDSGFPNSENPHTQLTPLGLAIKKGYVAIVSLLVSNACVAINDVGTGSGVGEGGLSSLMFALSTKNEAVALALLDHMDEGKLNITATDTEGNTPLHLAIKYGFKRLAHALMDKLSLEVLRVKNKQERAPLHMAIRYNQRGIFEVLFRKIADEGFIMAVGGDLTANNPEKLTKLTKTILREIAKRNKIADKNISVKNCLKPTNRFRESRRDNLHVVQTLGRFPLHMAIRCGLEGLACSMVYAFDIESVSIEDETGETPLHLSIAHGYTTLTELLVKKITLLDDLLKVDRTYKTSLHTAAYYGRKAAFKLVYDRVCELSGLDREEIFDALRPKHARLFSVFATAYLSSNGNFNHDPTKFNNEDMLKFILETVSKNLTPFQLKKCCEEIDYVANAGKCYGTEYKGVLWSRRKELYRSMFAAYIPIAKINFSSENLVADYKR